MYLLNANWFSGLVVVSGLIGYIATFLFFNGMKFFLENFVREIEFKRSGDGSVESVSFDLNRFGKYFDFITGPFTGFVERIFITIVYVLVDGGAMAVVVVALLGIKAQVHYQIFTKGEDLDKKADLPVRILSGYLGMFGSMASGVFGLLGGWIWLHCWSLTRIFNEMM